VPLAKNHKLKADSCTFAMARRDSFIGGPRYKIFQFLDGSPTLREAIEFASRQGMRDKGPRASWDILEALKQGCIEVR
jgi:hypothetical protein